MVLNMIPDHAREHIERFFATIAPWEDAYAYAGLSYLAVRREGVLHLLQSRLFLNTAPSLIPTTNFETNHVVASYFPLTDVGISYRDLIMGLADTGRIKSPVGELAFPLESEDRLAAYFVPFHQEGIAAGNRLPVLMLTGAQRHSYVQQPELDWALRGATHPFDSLQELLFEYSLGSYRGDVTTFEVVAPNVMEVVFSSKVAGEEAEPSVFLAKSLNPDLAQIGYRVFLHGKVVSRESVFGKDMAWSEQDRSLLGVGKVRIPRGAALHCVASYDGVAQHHGWIADPANSQNPRRATLEAN